MKGKFLGKQTKEDLCKELAGVKKELADLKSNQQRAETAYARGALVGLECAKLAIMSSDHCGQAMAVVQKALDDAHRTIEEIEARGA